MPKKYKVVKADPPYRYKVFVRTDIGHRLVGIASTLWGAKREIKRHKLSEKPAIVYETD